MMKGKNPNTIQNCFTAYLQTAITNRKIRYYKERSREKEREYHNDISPEETYSDFAVEFSKYLMEQVVDIFMNYDKLQDLLRLIGGERLPGIIGRMKERDRNLVLGRIFGELEFSEMGVQLGITAKQAEMAYYYTIRKLRNELGDKKDEF